MSPSLDTFARESTRFTAAVSQVPLTLPSHATILTGLHPSHHGVRTNDGFRLAATVPTLAEQLKAAGYRTGAFVGGYPVRAASGLARGFDRYDDAFLISPDASERSADEVMRSATLWVDEESVVFRYLSLPRSADGHTHDPPWSQSFAGAAGHASIDTYIGISAAPDLWYPRGDR